MSHVEDLTWLLTVVIIVSIPFRKRLACRQSHARHATPGAATTMAEGGPNAGLPRQVYHPGLHLSHVGCEFNSKPTCESFFNRSVCPWKRSVIVLLDDVSQGNFFDGCHDVVSQTFTLRIGDHPLLETRSP